MRILNPPQLPEHIVYKGSVVDITPASDKRTWRTIDGVYVSDGQSTPIGEDRDDNHHDASPLKGRQLPNRGIGNSRNLVCLVQTGCTPKELFKRALRPTGPASPLAVKAAQEKIAQLLGDDA